MGKLLVVALVVGLAAAVADIAGTDVLGGEARKQWCLATMDRGYCESTEFRTGQSEAVYEARVTREAEEQSDRMTEGQEEQSRRVIQAAVRLAEGNGGYFDEQRCVNDIVNGVAAQEGSHGRGLGGAAYDNVERLARAQCSEAGQKAGALAREALEIGRDLGARAGEGARTLRELIRQ